MLTDLVETKGIDTARAVTPPSFDLADLMDEHADYLFRFAVSRVHDTSTAEDLVQETFLALLKGKSDFQNKSSIRTWLTSILRNKIVDHFRRSCRELQLNELTDTCTPERDFFRPDGSWDPDYAPTDWPARPDTSFENREFWDIIGRSLAKIPSHFSAVFVLREIEGLSTDEVCQLLDISKANLWVLLHRARLLLRREIEANYFNMI